MLLNNLILINKETLISEVTVMKKKGFRFASLTAEKEDGNYELTYHFDYNFQMKHLRILVKPFDCIDSISNIYSSAFLIENEYQDLYGFTFLNLKIDYRGHLYMTDKNIIPLTESK